MDGSIHLKRSERKTLLDYYRKSADPALRLRAHILLLLADARPWSQIEAMLYTSTSTIRRLLATLPDDETAGFQDEVDINTNPKIGSMWMFRGQQAEVVTPGTNVKRYLTGSLHWRTGKLLVSSPGTQRNADLFVRHLDDLRRWLRGYRRIHVICDNAKFHDCAKVQKFLARWGHRIELHFLPKYAPKTNPIERVWWHLHEEITRNHRCKTIDELVQLTFDWIGYKSTFDIETSAYPEAVAA